MFSPISKYIHHRWIAFVVAIVAATFATSTYAQDCPIRIGGLAPLSAPGSVTGGEAQRIAMEIAVDDINEAGGVLDCAVELVVGDTEGLPEKGTAIMEKLIGQDNVIGVGGGYHSSVGIAAKDVAHNKGVPVVFASTWNDQITATQLPEVFRVAPLSSEASAIYWKFAQSVPGAEKAVIVNENTDYGIAAAEETETGLREAGFDVAVFAVDQGSQDFAPVIQRVKAENPDVIITLVTGEAGYNWQQQAAENGIGPSDVPFLCDIAASESEAFWTNVPDGNHCFVSQFGLPETLFNERAKRFAAEYKRRSGKDGVESYAVEAYDSVGLIAAAANAAGSTDGAAIVRALESISYDGALGTITFPVNSSNPPSAAGKPDKWWHQYPDPALMLFQYQEDGQRAIEAPIVFPDGPYKTGEPVYP